MPSPIPAATIAQIRDTVGVLESARVFITGEAVRFQAALASALANGATEAELAPIQQEIDALKAGSDAVAAAIAANPTP